MNKVRFIFGLKIICFNMKTLTNFKNYIGTISLLPLYYYFKNLLHPKSISNETSFYKTKSQICSYHFYKSSKEVFQT